MPTEEITTTRKSPVHDFLKEKTDCKVYVRNVPWASTEDDLKHHFSSAGIVADVLIPRFNDRARGYAYVAFHSAAAAEKAIQTVNKTKMGDREISVQIAILRTEEELREIAARKAEAPPRRRGDRRSNARADDKKPVKPTHEESAAPSSPSKSNNFTESTTPRRGLGDKRGAGRGAARSNTTTERPVSPAKRTTNNEKAPALPEMDYSRTLFVGNLPWSVKEEELAEIFKEYQPTKVAVPRVHYNPERTKGYGLVEFKSVQLMSEVISDLEEVVVNSRTLVLKQARPSVARA